MVVVTIIAVLSALVLPSMTQAIRERHAQEAAVEVIDLLREVRSRAMYRGRAQTVAIRQVGTTVRFEAYEGRESSCRLSRFREASTGSGFVAAEQIASLDLGAGRYAADGIVSMITLPTGLMYLQLCFTPMGNTFFATEEVSNPSAVWSNDSGAVGSGGVFQIDLFQARDGVVRGARRRVVIPLGGIPRLRTA